MQTESLIVVDEFLGRVYPLVEGDTVIGRMDACDIVVPRGSVGRRHAILRWENGEVTVEDLRSTNGTYVVPHHSETTGASSSLVRGRQRLEVGDQMYIGIAKLVLRPATWLGDEPPVPLPVEPLEAKAAAPVVDAARDGGDLTVFDSETLDAAWTSAFLRWRRAPTPQPIFDLAARMCSPMMVCTLRDGIDDPHRWFVDRGLDVVRMLAASPHAIGFPLTLDVRLRHASRGFREVAGSEVRRLSSDAGISITELACARFLQLAANVPVSDMNVRFAQNAIESARKQGITWSVRAWRELLAVPAFAIAARCSVFLVVESEEMFRPEDGELLGLDRDVVLPPRAQIAVAQTLTSAWNEHLAEYEVVQPFDQELDDD